MSAVSLHARASGRHRPDSSPLHPLGHYMQFGWQEGRDPSLAFDTLDYLAANPDVAAAGANPLERCLTSGVYEGRHAVWH